MNVSRPNVENSMFAQEFFDLFPFSDMAYRRLSPVPFVPPKHAEEFVRSGDAMERSTGYEEDFTGDQSLFNRF